MSWGRTVLSGPVTRPASLLLVLEVGQQGFSQVKVGPSVRLALRWRLPPPYRNRLYNSYITELWARSRYGAFFSLTLPDYCLPGTCCTVLSVMGYLITQQGWDEGEWGPLGQTPEGQLRSATWWQSSTSLVFARDFSWFLQTAGSALAGEAAFSLSPAPVVQTESHSAAPIGVTSAQKYQNYLLQSNTWGPELR